MKKHCTEDAMSIQQNFNDIKNRVSFEQVATMLGLSLKQVEATRKSDGAKYMQWRGKCPKCNGGDRSLAITPGEGFTCFSTKLSDGKFPGGSVLDLVAHVKGVDLRQAAEMIASQCTVPRDSEPAKATVPDSLSKVHGYLRWDHPDVQALGIDPATARKLGCGYKPTGCFSGSVVFPLYLHRDGKAGELVSYAALKDGRLRFFKRVTQQV
jgi:hypothetical protein